MIPLDPEILSIVERDAGQIKTPQLDVDVDALVKDRDESIKARRDYLRDAYAWGLVAPLKATRGAYARNVVNEIRDPEERQWLAEEVEKIAQAQEWSQRKEYGEAGYLRRFETNLQKVGSAFVEGGSGMVEAFGKIGRKAPSKEDISFLRSLEAARQGANPFATEAPGLSGAMATGAAQIAPDMAAGLLATIGGGPVGAAGYWTTRGQAESIEDYVELGLSPEAASLAGTGTAGAVGLVELLNIDPTGLLKRGAAAPVKGAIRRGITKAAERFGGKAAAQLAKHPVARRVIGAGLETAKRLGLEAAEEGIQGSLTEAGLHLAAKSSEEIPDRQAGDILREGIAQTLESAPALALPAMLGGSAKISGAVGRYRSLRKGASDARIRDEIMDMAAKGHAPSRKTWQKLGLDRDMPETSARQRREAIQQLADDYRHLEQVRLYMTGITPTVEQWKRLGLPDEAGRTEETRKSYLREKFSPPQFEGQEQQPQSEEQLRSVPTEVIDEIHQQAGAQTSAGVASALAGKQMEAEQPPVFDTATGDVRRGAVREFLTDVAGRVGVSVDGLWGGLSTGLKTGTHLVRRFLTSRGELPESVYDLDVSRRGSISALQKRVAFTAADYKRALKTVFGDVDAVTPEQQASIDAALKGEAPIESLPEPLRGPVSQMRQDIDTLSSELIRSGAVQGELAATVAGNLGVYVTRSYRAFDDPKWANKVPKQVRNKAAALLRQEYPDKSEAEIHGLIEAILYAAKESGSPMGLLSRAALGEKDLSILRRRKEVPDEIRALLGEHKDPMVNYARSVTQVGQLVANHKFLAEARKAGMGTFFAEEPTVGKYGELKARIEAKPGSSLAPLAGVYTTPEIADALKRATDGEAIPTWLRFVLQANGAVKASKTVFSLMTHVRNLVGNVGFAVANGHWRAGKAGGAFRATLTSLVKLPDAKWRAYYLRAVELGIVGQDVHSGELRDHLRDAASKDIEGFAFDAEKRRAHKAKASMYVAFDTVADVYQAEDDVWKLYGWENEKDRYREAYPDMPEAELEAVTASIVQNTYPTYAKVPEAIRHLRRFPMVGTFVSFPAEVIRTAVHTTRLAGEELADPARRKIGAERAAGLLLSLTATSAATIASRLLFGVSAGDDDELREFVAPWQTNSPLMHFGSDGKGNFRFVDMAYSDPHNYLMTPFKALMRGETIGEGVWDAMKDIAKPFVGEEILFGKFMDVWKNDDNGRKVYNPQDSIDGQAGAVAAHLWSAFEPGTLTSLKRIDKGITGEKAKSGRGYSPSIETIALLTGQRIQDLDVQQSLGFRVRTLRTAITESNSVLTEVMNRRGHVSASEIENAYQTADASRRRAYAQLTRIVHAASKLGVSPDDVRQSLKSGGVPESELNAVLGGTYPRIALSKQRMQSMSKANPQEFKSRYEALVEVASASAPAVSASQNADTLYRELRQQGLSEAGAWQRIREAQQ